MIETKRIKVKVKLEGVEVPFNSVNISESSDAPPTASIAFPTNKKIIHILPKTIVQVFYEIDNIYYLIFQGELAKYGITRNPDRRQVELQFQGFTQNWASNFVTPMGISIPIMAANAIHNIGINTVDSSNAPISEMRKFQFSSTFVTPLNKLMELINKISVDNPNKAAMEEALLAAIRAFSYTGLYYKKISKAFGITEGDGDSIKVKQISILGSDTIAKLIIGKATINFLKGNLPETLSALSIHQALETLLRYFGYDFCEVAVPSLVNDELKRIFIKPKTYNLSPMLCNTIFNDEIQDLQFSRESENEPTRLISNTAPFYMLGEGNNEFASVSLSVVVPQRIWLGEELDKLKDVTTGVINITSEQLLKLTDEERCRGIMPMQYQDVTGIEEAYVYSVMEKVPNVANAETPDMQNEQIDALSPESRKKVLKEFQTQFAKTKEQQKDTEFSKIRDYHTDMAMINFSEARAASRGLSLVTPYSPYRMCGFPGTILTDEFPPMVGVVRNIQSTISADGQALQVVSFHHIKIASSLDGPTYSFFDETNIEVVPAWYEDFAYSKINDALYYPITGKTQASLHAKYPTVGGMVSAINKMQSEYQNNIDKLSFIKETTNRPLVSENDLYNKYWPSEWGTKAENFRSFTQTEFPEVPFVIERIERVNEIFGKAKLPFTAAATPVSITSTTAIATAPQQTGVAGTPVVATSFLPLPYDPLINKYAAEYNVDPLLIKAMMSQESANNPNAVSKKNAKGLMQLMGPAAQDMGVTDIFDPEQNIRGGTRYISIQLKEFDGDLNLALAAYNAGPGAVKKWGNIVPPFAETTDYVTKVKIKYRKSGGKGYGG